MTETTVIVSGLPRSGTSMMMRMLGKGGFPLLTDAERPPDPDNPRGYYEYGPVKRLREDASWFSRAAMNHAVKVVSFLLPELPPDLNCHIIFMERELEEILASQRTMVSHRIMAGNADPSKANPAALDIEDARLRDLYARHLKEIRNLFAARKKLRVLYIAYGATLQDPAETARRVTSFLGVDLDKQAMVSAVEPELRRQHRKPDDIYPKMSP